MNKVGHSEVLAPGMMECNSITDESPLSDYALTNSVGESQTDPNYFRGTNVANSVAYKKSMFLWITFDCRRLYQIYEVLFDSKGPQRLYS